MATILPVHNRSRLLAAGAAAMAAFVLMSASACSSSGSSGGKDGGKTQSGQSASSGVDLAKARSIVAKYSKRPTVFPETTPVGKPIPTGKTIVYINCGTPQCAANVPVFTGIAKMLGWKLNAINTDGSSQQILNAWAQILRTKPDGVLYGGTPRSEFNSALLKAKAEGIAVVADGVTDPATDGLTAVVDGAPDIAADSKALGAWLVADGGAKTSAVVLSIPDFPVLNSVASSIKSTFAQLCKQCSVSTLSVPPSAIGASAPNLIVSYLRSHPDVKYVASSLGALNIGVPAALKAAGINGVKLTSIIPSSGNVQDILTGQEAVSVTPDDGLYSYAQMDIFARLFAGVPAPNTANVVWILTKANAPKPTAQIDVLPDLSAHYASLWGK